MENEKKRIIFSGMQPTGALHIGNWAGSLKNWLTLQDENLGALLKSAMKLMEQSGAATPEKAK